MHEVRAVWQILPSRPKGISQDPPDMLSGALKYRLPTYKIRGLTYPNLRRSAPAIIEATVHLANLQELFFNSEAITAPRWVSSLLRQLTPLQYCLMRERGGGQDEVLKTLKISAR